METIKPKGLKSFFENSANHAEIRREIQRLRGPPEDQIVNNNAPPLCCPLDELSQFGEFGIPEVLHPQPYANSDDREYESDRFCTVEQGEAKKPKSGGNRVEDEHRFTLRPTALEQPMMNVFVVSPEQGLPAEESPHHGECNIPRIGRPKETTGMATATMVGAFCDPSKASALNMKPINWLPESPRNIVAGLKL